MQQQQQPLITTILALAVAMTLLLHLRLRLRLQLQLQLLPRIITIDGLAITVTTLLLDLTVNLLRVNILNYLGQQTQRRT
jgi:hypothetical protein